MFKVTYAILSTVLSLGCVVKSVDRLFDGSTDGGAAWMALGGVCILTMISHFTHR